MMPVQVAFLNRESVSEFSNRQMLLDYDMTQPELAAWTSSGAIHPDDHPKVRVQIEEIIAGQRSTSTLRMRYKDGSYRWMRCICVPCRDAQGNIVRYVTCQTDVHDLKHADDLLATEVKLLEMVARGEPHTQVLDALSRGIEDLCGGCFCSVLLVPPDRKHFQLGAGPSLPSAYNDLLDGMMVDGGYTPHSLAVIEKAPIVTADLANDRRWEGSPWLLGMKSVGFGSCCAMPIISASGGVYGVVAIYRTGAVTPTAQEKELVDRFTKIAGIAIDRAEADAALQSRERDLREALVQLSEGQRLSKTGSFTADIRQDRHRWSDEFYRIFEIDPATPPRLEAVRARVHPDDLQLFDTEMPSRIEGGGGDFTFRIVTPKDGLKHLSAVAHLIEHVADRPTFIGTVQDVTERKYAEAALKASEAEQRRANMQLTDAHRLSRTGSFTWDVLADNHIWTEEIFRLFEFDPATKVNMQMMFESIHPEDRPAVESLLGRAVESAEFDFGFRVMTRTGSLKHARVIGRRIGQVTDRPVFMGAMQDVTSSKVAEEALNQARLELTHVARLATLSAMTASITHEVSQPISGILTNANTCARMLAADPPNVVGAAETVRRTIRDANRASEVIKRLRAMFAKKVPTMEMVDLNEAAREVIAISSAELRRSRSVLQEDFAESLPAISGDRVQLQQVILNLLLNAADAMSGIEDRPRTLRVQTQVHGSDSIKLLVQDSGVGLDPRGIDKLFEAFYTTKAQGLGIGLAISRSIIESHKGKLWAMANDGPGATFGFCIPCAPGSLTCDATRG
jgi:signal transduction histidine kinase